MLCQGLSPGEIAKTLQVAIAIVREIDATDPAYARARKLAQRRGTAAPMYTDDDILACLRAASDEIGGILTTAAYDRLARQRTFPDGRLWPTHQTAFNRFGSWREALTATGLRSNPSTPIAGKRLFTDGNCIDAVLEAERALGRLPSAKDYEEYSVGMAGAIPSAATVRNRLGRWHNVLRRAADFAATYNPDR